LAPSARKAEGAYTLACRLPRVAAYLEASASPAAEIAALVGARARELDATLRAAATRCRAGRARGPAAASA